MMNIRFLKFLNVVAVFFFFAMNSVSAEVSADAGKKLFTNYCAQCHAKNMKTKLTGPALAGYADRWPDQADLYAWIRNSQAMIAAGHPRAVEVWNEYKPTIMTAFPDLTDDEIGSILAYVDGVVDGTIGGAPKTDIVAGGPVAEKKDNKWMYIGITALLALLALFLARIIGNLNQMVAAKDGKVIGEQTLWQSMKSKGIVTMIVFALVVFGGYTTINKSIDLGRQQGYAPEQPIKFSHETHAGLHKIDCQYCHDGARRSKHSVIPAANTCMNCHRAIKVGSQYGTAELTKIYASIGYEPISNTYIEDYESKTEEEIKEIYTKWMASSYVEEKGLAEIDADGEILVAEQWEDLVKSLTNEQKKSIQGPIEWTRIHNLPDHVYFNHAQHVSVAKLECQTCHGPVEKMEVLRQHSPLSMGWCINCHRQTEVKFNDNDYYKSYARFHEELQSGQRDKVTVSDIGGLECQKCHY